jgi:transcription termination factor Rho
VPPAAAAGTSRGRLNINDLKDMSIQKLTQVGKDLAVQGATGMRKQDLIFQILRAQTEQSGFIFSEGVLEILPDGFGCLRAPDYNYLIGALSAACVRTGPSRAPRYWWQRYSGCNSWAAPETCG